jgi:hypothetical protein
MTPEKVEELAQSGFEGLSLKELRECCKVVGIEAHHLSKEDRLRKDLCAVFGVEVKSEAAPVAKAGGKPNLTSDGVWGGRCRDVTIHRNDETKKDKGLYLGWENMRRYYFFGIRSTLPYPLYEILKNAVGAISNERDMADEEGRISTHREWQDQQKHPYTDHGDTPGTENLPRHMIDYYQGLAARMGNFAGFNRRKLAAIMADLHGKERAAFLMKDKTDEEVLFAIHAHLGLLKADDDIDIAA